MAPLAEEAAAAPATTAATEAPKAPKGPAVPETDTPNKVKTPSGWKLFATVLTQIDVFN